MNEKYHKYIKNSVVESIDFGIYPAPRLLFPQSFPNARKNWKLPLRMYDRGLLVIGDSWRESGRELFASFYARKLVENNIRVVFITDSQASPNQDEHPETKAQNKFTESLKLDKHEIHEAYLSEEVDPLMFDRGTKISILHSGRSKIANKENSLAYHTNLLRTLRVIAESNISDHRNKSLNGDLVIVIEENLYGLGVEGSELEEAICWLQGRGLGVVLSRNDTRGIRNIVNSFQHYLFFRMDDSAEEIDAHDFFFWRYLNQAQSIDCDSDFRIDSRDLSCLGADECHYIVRDRHKKDVTHCFGTFRHLSQ